MLTYRQSISKITGQAVTAINGLPENIHTLIYSANPGGIFAACKLAELGKSALIISPTPFIGGVLGWGIVSPTDLFTGTTPFNDWQLHKDIVAKYFTYLAAYYGKTWQQFYALSANAESAGFQYALNQLISEYGLNILLGYRVISGTKSGTRIVSATFERDDTPQSATNITLSASFFIDASYDLDLLRATGIACTATYGREANATYGETYNGVRAVTYLSPSVDAYVTEGVSVSGLLPNLQAAATVGTADASVQAFTYRAPTTTDPSGRPIPEPSSYNPLLYEIFGRAIVAKNLVTTASIMGTSAMQGGALTNQSNHNYSQQAMPDLDFVGGNITWKDATYAQRKVIQQSHKDYVLGFYKFLKTDSRVSAAIKADVNAWKLPPISVMPTGDGMPPLDALYVRESYRLVGDTVFSEQYNTIGTGSWLMEDWIGQATFLIDSHWSNIVVSEAGKCGAEGDIASGNGNRWNIPYLALCPKSAEVTNAWATFGVSMSHSLFQSFRMIPSEMIAGAAAGAAAYLADVNASTAQAVPSSQVRALTGYAPVKNKNSIVVSLQLGKIATNGTYTTNSGTYILAGTHTMTQLLDVSSSSDWAIYGQCYGRWDTTTPRDRTAKFYPNIATGGNFDLYIYFQQYNAASRSTAVPITVVDATGTHNLTINQQTSDGRWYKLGTFNFTAGSPSAHYAQIGDAGTASSTYVAINAFAWVPTP